MSCGILVGVVRVYAVVDRNRYKRARATGEMSFARGVTRSPPRSCLADAEHEPMPLSDIPIHRATLIFGAPCSAMSCLATAFDARPDVLCRYEPDAIVRPHHLTPMAPRERVTAFRCPAPSFRRERRGSVAKPPARCRAFIGPSRFAAGEHTPLIRLCRGDEQIGGFGSA
jgi:hypothetical protein